MGDIIVSLILAILISFALCQTVKKKGNHCGGDCSSCHGACHIDWKKIKKEIG